MLSGGDGNAPMLPRSAAGINKPRGFSPLHGNAAGQHFFVCQTACGCRQ
jgi:hypothetical protein